MRSSFSRTPSASHEAGVGETTANDRLPSRNDDDGISMMAAEAASSSATAAAAATAAVDIIKQKLESMFTAEHAKEFEKI